MKRVILSGIVAGIAMLAVGMVVGQIFSFLFPLNAEYNNTALFRPWSDPPMSVYFAAPFVLGIILAYIWQRVKTLFKEKNYCGRGTCFGIWYWLVTIPGMIITYSSFQISLLMTLSWSISIFAQGLTAGVIFAKMNK